MTKSSLAWAEMYIFIGSLFRPGGYKMTLTDCDESDVIPVRDSDIGIPKRNSRGVGVYIG